MFLQRENKEVKDDKERKRMINLTKNGIVLKLRIREVIEQLSSLEK